MSQFPMDFNTLYGMYQQRRMMNQPSPLAAAYNQQFNMGNYNNEVRYGDIIGGRTGIYDRNMDRINSLGAQEREDINRRADQMLSSQRSDLVSRGLGGTTVRQSIENKNLEDRNRALRQQSDNEVRQRIATDSSLADNVYATMERRNDITPDLGQLAQLQQAVGASGMYGQYPGYSGPGMGHIGGGGYQPPAPRFELHGAGGIGPTFSNGNGAWGAGARQPVGRPGNRLPGYDSSQGRPRIGNHGPESFMPGGSAYTGPPIITPGGGMNGDPFYYSRGNNRSPYYNSGPTGPPAQTMPGTGGSAGGYPLPGGGTSTPTYMPQPFPGPGQMPGQGGWNPGMTLPNNGMISKYRDGDRVGSAIESQLLNRIKGYSGVSDRSGNSYGQQQPQGGGMIRTAGDINRSPQQQINDYMQNRMRDNVYGINPNPTFKGMGGPPTFTIGGMPQYMTAQQPIYGGGGYGVRNAPGRTGYRGNMGGIPLSGPMAGGPGFDKEAATARRARINDMARSANAGRHAESMAARNNNFQDMIVDVPSLSMPSMPGMPGSQSLGVSGGYTPSAGGNIGYGAGLPYGAYGGGMSSVPSNPLYEPNAPLGVGGGNVVFSMPSAPRTSPYSPNRAEEVLEMNRRNSSGAGSRMMSDLDQWLYGMGQPARDNVRGQRPRY